MPGAEFVVRFMPFDNALLQIPIGQSVIIVGKFTVERTLTMKQMKALPQTHPLRLPGLGDIIPTLLMFLISRSCALGMCPFAVAFFAAAYSKNIAYVGIIASVAGIATALEIVEVPKYFLALLLYWIFEKIYTRDSVTVKSLASGIAMAIGGLTVSVFDYNGLFDLFLLLTESMITVLMYIIFNKAIVVADDFHKRQGMSNDDYICVAVTTGAILSGLSIFSYGGINLTHILTSYILLTAAVNTTVAVSAATGLSIGFMASMSDTGAVILMGVYGFGGMFAGFMNNYRKPGAFIGYISAVSVMLIYAQNIYDVPMGVLNAVIGGVLFMLTPKVVDEYMRSFFTKSIQVESVSPVRRMKEYLTLRLSRTATTFHNLYECFLAMSESRLKKYSEDVGIILDETAERVCKGCKMCGKCWQTDFRRTYKNTLELISTMETEGGLSIDNAPESFLNRCERTEEFIKEINHIYELYKRDILRRGDAVTTRNLILAQYNELGRVFDDMTVDISDGFEFLEKEEEDIVDALDKHGIIPYEISVVESNSGICEVYLRLPHSASMDVCEGIISHVLKRTVTYDSTENGLSKFSSGALYEMESSVLQLARDGFGVNGDSVTMFTVNKSKFYCIIADGMGSGNDAKYESASACKLLSGFLKSGFSVKTALGVLNSAMCLNMENEMFSTIDLLCVDLYKGEANLYKIGSAQTMMLCRGEVKTISSQSAPIGILSDIRLDKKTVSLGEGDVILMMSDGITESGCSISRTEWIKKIIIKPWERMDDLAREVMDTALAKNNDCARDDMTVVALKIMSK